MSKNKQISKEKSIQRAKFATEIVICAAVVCAGAYLLKGVANRSEVIGVSPYADVTVVSDSGTEPTTAPENSNGIIYDIVSKPTTDIFKGELILVNNENEYIGGGEDLVCILEKNGEYGRDFFSAADYTYTIAAAAYEPMAQMIEEFYNKTGLDNLSIWGSYRTKEFQQGLYDEDLAATGEGESTRVAKPGHSEHESGYAFDFTTIPDYDFDGTGEYAWFAENCWNYGFILRYPEGKSDITEIEYEPWHFRYVGVPHAVYMKNNNLVLEEYIELLKKYPYDPSGESHLRFSDANGKEYEVYYVAADFSMDTTNIPVPSGIKSTISGNNIDGFIVTVYIGEKPDAPEDTAEEETSGDAGEDTDEESDNGDGEDSDSEES